jgi:hypothetical protein
MDPSPYSYWMEALAHLSYSETLASKKKFLKSIEVVYQALECMSALSSTTKTCTFQIEYLKLQLKMTNVIACICGPELTFEVLHWAAFELDACCLKYLSLRHSFIDIDQQSIDTMTINAAACMSIGVIVRSRILMHDTRPSKIVEFSRWLDLPASPDTANLPIEAKAYFYQAIKIYHVDPENPSMFTSAVQDIFSRYRQTPCYLFTHQAPLTVETTISPCPRANSVLNIKKNHKFVITVDGKLTVPENWEARCMLG